MVPQGGDMDHNLLLYGEELAYFFPNCLMPHDWPTGGGGWAQLELTDTLTTLDAFTYI